MTRFAIASVFPMRPPLNPLLNEEGKRTAQGQVMTQLGSSVVCDRRSFDSQRFSAIIERRYSKLPYGQGCSRAADHCSEVGHVHFLRLTLNVGSFIGQSFLEQQGELSVGHLDHAIGRNLVGDP